MIKNIIIIFISYFIGTISLARIIANIQNIDLKSKGTKNPGATNVYRLVSPKWGILTGAIDFFKGFIPVYIVKELLNYDWVIIIAVSVAAVAGHNWPFQYNFNGGRGLATSMGTLGAVSFVLGLISFIIGGLILWIIRKHSNKDWRIPYFVYPVFVIITINFNYNINILIYVFFVLLIACLRGWQVKTR